MHFFQYHLFSNLQTILIHLSIIHLFSRLPLLHMFDKNIHFQSNIEEDKTTSHFLTNT